MKQRLVATILVVMLAVMSAVAFAVQGTGQAQTGAPQGAPQGPPPGGGPGGGRGGGIPGATPEQTQALAEMTTALGPPTLAATTARNELGAAALADAGNEAALKAAADKVQAAELELASKRADEFAKLQAGPNKLNADQIIALIAEGGAAGGRGGGRGGPGGPGGRGGAPAGAAPAPGAPAAATPQAGAPAQGNPPPAGPPGGGRGGVSFSPAQGLALAAMTIPQTAVQAAADARTALVRASLTLPANAADLRTKAGAVANSERTLAVARASELARAGGTGLKLTTEQLAAIVANNGLPRGGNTSPGGTFEYGDYTGFTKIWDGRTLTGWNGETDAWSIENDAIHMDTAKKPGQHHIHFTGLPGVSPILKDFDLKVEFKTSAGNFNGGIQYRSRLLTGHGPNRSIYDPATIADPLGQPLPPNLTTQAATNAAGIAGQPWQVSGYQFDITGNNLGSLYEGQGRGVIVNAGEVVQLFPGGLKYVIGRAADNPAQYSRPNLGLDGEWNQIEIIARGNSLVHILNGHVITVTTDDDPMRRAFQGILSLQCEGGAIWYRNVYLKHLEPITTPSAR